MQAKHEQLIESDVCCNCGSELDEHERADEVCTTCELENPDHRVKYYNMRALYG